MGLFCVLYIRCVTQLHPECLLSFFFLFFFVFHAIFVYSLQMCISVYFFFLSFLNSGTSDSISHFEQFCSKETASLRNVTVNVFLYIGVYMCIHVTMLYICCLECSAQTVRPHLS